MSQRGDRGEGHARRPGRSSSFGGHRGGGGVGGAGKGGGGPSGQPPLSSNRSFRKPGNGHGGHQRVVSQSDTTGFQPAPAPAPLQTAPRPPVPQSVPVHVPAPAPRPQHHDSSRVQAPAIPSVSENQAHVPLAKIAPHAAPRAPSKGANTSAPQGALKGDSSKEFNMHLQFGSINLNPNGLPQFPARTSSAPPNLDEQRRMQALPEGLKVATPVLVPPASKQQQQKQQPVQQQKQQQQALQQQPPPPQQQTRKDAVSSSQPNPVNANVPSQVKRDVHISQSVPNVAPPRSAVQQMPGMSVPMNYHHQPVPLQFGVHNPQITSQGVVPSSLQMPMGLHGGNAPQVQQQMYVPNIQHHQLQQQTMMHQAQGMPFVPPAGHQLTPQMGTMNMGQYAQQQNKFVHRKSTVKITDPVTHEELKLDKRIDSSGQRGLPAAQAQSQPVPNFGFYTPMQQNSYNQQAMFYSTNNTGGSHAPPRFGYPQAGPPISYVNSAVLTTVPASNKDNVAGPAASGHSQVAVKHPSGLHMEKSGAHTVTISAPPGKLTAPKLRPTEEAVSHRQKDILAVSGVTVSNKSGNETESKLPSVTEKHPTLESQPLQIQDAKPETTSLAFPVLNSTSVLFGADGKNKEPIQRTESSKDNKNNATRNLSEQQSASSAEDLKMQTSAKVGGGDRVGLMEANIVNKESDMTSSTSDTIASVSENRIAPGAGKTEADSKSLEGEDRDVCMDGGSAKLKEDRDVGMDGGSAKLTSEDTGNHQGLGQFDVAPVESEENEVTRKLSPELSKDNISSDSTKNESCEVTMELVEPSLMISGPDNSDATALAVQRQLPEESHSSTESLSDFVDSNAVSIASSETSSEATTQNANNKGDARNNQETGLAISHSIPDSVVSDELPKPESMVKDDQSSGEPVASIRPVSREKPSEITRTKSSAGKKKKRKEMLSKADAAGSSDLYNAYKGPEEKQDSIGTTESADGSTVDATHELTDESEREVNMGEDDGKRKVEPDDWEDAADMSTPKLQGSDSGNQDSAAQSDSDNTEANGKKRYSRDFLLTLKHNCSDLPVGLQMGDYSNGLFLSLQGKSYVVDHPSPGRGTERPASRGDRRGAAMDDDRWTKQGHPFSGHAHMDLNGPAGNHRGAPGQHGVVRNPRGLLVGPVAPAIPRSGSDADRWQHGKGLFPSPVTPMQIMHKAEKKYVVGKASDEEEAKQRQLKGILNKLTPQNFEKLFEKVKEVNIDSVTTLTGVISQIFDKALMEPTFCEMYANFCFHLATALPDFSEHNEKITFKRLLLNKCQEEFEKGEREEAEAEKTEEDGEIKQTKEEREEKRVRARKRMLGNIRLIGELYKKRMLTERIMHECINKLLGNVQNPDEENIEALCKLMSTIGEMIDHSKAKEHMDAYFDILRKLSTSQLLSSRVRFMLRDSIDLRRNKWQQRRKVEGPKKIDEVHRDAANERHAQSSRLARGQVVNSGSRRPMDYGPRGSAGALASPGSQQAGLRGMPSHSRGFGNQDIRNQDIRLEERHQFDNRTVPLPQRSTKDEGITLGPQGGLARGMRGQPVVSSTELPSAVDHRRMVSGPNGHNSVASTARDDPSLRIPDRSGRTAPTTQSAGPSHRPASQEGRSGNKSYSQEDLREKSVAAIREYYSAKDEKEVALCVEELNAPSFYASVVSIWVNDSFERKDLERELLTKLLVSLCNGRNNLLSKSQLIEGLASVLDSLEDTLSDAPRASEYLGRLLARFVLENILSLQEVGRLIEEGGEEPGYLVREGIAADVLGAVLESIKVEKGDPFLNEAKKSSNLKLEDFRPQHLKRSKLDAFF